MYMKKMAVGTDVMEWFALLIRTPDILLQISAGTPAGLTAVPHVGIAPQLRYDSFHIFSSRLSVWHPII
jgi:hypothetical protein